MPSLPKSFEEIFNCTIAQFRILQCDKFFMKFTSHLIHVVRSFKIFNDKGIVFVVKDMAG